MNTSVLFILYSIVWGVLFAAIITFEVISRKLKKNIEKFDEDTKTDYSVDILFGGALTPMERINMSSSDQLQYISGKFALMRDLDEYKEFAARQLLGDEDAPVSLDYGKKKDQE